ncbi:MAG: HRDC domain-containing protein [Candidatus Omnitrophica bacterium]|nr:HRDC domain-containing protein [Candidatus Omnitrophota bacterium]
MRLIDNPELLDRALEVLSACDSAAVDTEADSLHHYAEKLCLVQISTPDDDLVIDPLAGLDLGPLCRLLEEKKLVFHGADFDIRMLKKSSGFEPKEIFDTLLAAQLLGYEKQGLADLVARHYDVTLSKANQKADWSRRPLGDDLLKYAANDTHYLLPLRAKLRGELEALGREGWHRQSCHRLRESLANWEENPVAEEDEWRIKGSKALKGKALVILKALWTWREEEAKKKDRPRFKIVNGEYLIDVARWSSENPGRDIALWPDAPRNIRGTYREVINAVIKQSEHLPPVEPYKRTFSGPKKRWGNRESERFQALREAREKIAAELKIRPSLLATNAVLELVSSDPPIDRRAMKDSGFFMPWQAEVLAGRFLEILHASRQAGHGAP